MNIQLLVLLITIVLLLKPMPTLDKSYFVEGYE